MSSCDSVRARFRTALIRNLAAFCSAVLLALTAVHAQSGSRSVVLPQSTASYFAKRQLCSRPGPPKFDGTWTPSDADIQELESRLSKISKLRTHGFRRSRRIQHPDEYYRQYLGIRVGKRNLIYINALDSWDPTRSPEVLSIWRNTPIIGCDGGDSFWGAVYDPASGTFSDLEINLSLGGD